MIAYSLRFPQSSTPEEFWRNRVNEVESVRDIPPERRDHAAYYSPRPDESGTYYCPKGGFIKNVDHFDPLFFNISPKEAQVINPKQRLFLKSATGSRFCWI